MKSTLLLIIALMTLGSLQTHASRACTSEDYGLVDAKLFKCNMGSSGRQWSFRIYTSSLGVRVDSPQNSSPGSFFPGPRVVIFDTLDCPVEWSSNGDAEPTFSARDGLSVSIDPQALPTVVIQKQDCRVDVQGSTESGDYSWETSVQTTQEVIRCQFAGKTLLATKHPSLDICGYPDPGY